MEKNSRLRLFIYGKNALNDILNINKTLKLKLIDNNKYKIRPYFGIDTNTNWEYLIFQSKINEDYNNTIKDYLEEHYKSNNLCKVYYVIEKLIIPEYLKNENDDELNKKISDILLEYHKFYDILVICVDNLLDEDSKLAFKYFQGFSAIRAQQPFILFLTKKDDKPKIEVLFQFITNEFFDKRNVYSYKYPTNKEEIDKINQFFIKCMNYYQELGSCEIDFLSKYFNVLICGHSGVGKSSFINQFLQDKIAKEGEGIFNLPKIKNYILSKYSIRIFGTPGFESGDSYKLCLSIFKNFEKDMKNSNNHIDLILYFVEL